MRDQDRFRQGIVERKAFPYRSPSRFVPVHWRAPAGPPTRTHSKPPRGGSHTRGAANGPCRTLFFPRLFCSPPLRRQAGSELQHRIVDKPFNAVMLPIVVPALGMRNIRLGARLKIREPFLDRPDQHRLRQFGHVDYPFDRGLEHERVVDRDNQVGAMRPVEVPQPVTCVEKDQRGRTLDVRVAHSTLLMRCGGTCSRPEPPKPRDVGIAATD